MYTIWGGGFENRADGNGTLEIMTINPRRIIDLICQISLMRFRAPMLFQEHGAPHGAEEHGADAAELLELFLGEAATGAGKHFVVVHAHQIDVGEPHVGRRGRIPAGK